MPTRSRVVLAAASLLLLLVYAFPIWKNRVYFDDGSQIDYDVLITGVSHVGAAPGRALPTNQRGFINTRLTSRQVVGYDNAYAIGDVSDYPVKQGYLARCFRLMRRPSTSESSAWSACLSDV